MKNWYRSCGVCIECERDLDAISDFMLRAVKLQLYGKDRFYVLEKEVDGEWDEIATINGHIYTNLKTNP